MSKIEIHSELSVEETDEALEKSLKRKRECSHGERYADKAFDDFHDSICEKHEKLVKKMTDEIMTELKRSASQKGL